MNSIKKYITAEWHFGAPLPALVWQLFFLVLPLAVIVAYSFYNSAATSWWGMVTVHAYREVWARSYLLIIGRSIVLALSTALLCLFAAYPVSYYLALHVHRYKNMLLFLLVLPFWVNFLVQIYAWYFLLEYNGLLNTVLISLGLISEPILFMSSQGSILLVMVYCYLPFMIMPLYSILEKIDRRLLESSADLGATAWQTFTTVTLPLSFSGIKTGFLLVLIPAFGEFAIPSLMGGGKYMMVGSLISYLFLVARDNALGAAFTIASAGVLIALLFMIYLLTRLYTGSWYKDRI